MWLVFLTHYNLSNQHLLTSSASNNFTTETGVKASKAHTVSSVRT
jgi:hypothetical protein